MKYIHKKFIKSGISEVIVPVHATLRRTVDPTRARNICALTLTLRTRIYL